MSRDKITNPTGGSGFHRVTGAAGPVLKSVKTGDLVGHQLKVTAYGNSIKGQNVQLFVNDIAITAPISPQSESFVYDVIIVIDASENKIVVQVDSPITDTNVRQSVTQFNPLPETIVFSLQGTSAVHSFELWKLGIDPIA